MTTRAKIHLGWMMMRTRFVKSMDKSIVCGTSRDVVSYIALPC